MTCQHDPGDESDGSGRAADSPPITAAVSADRMEVSLRGRSINLSRDEAMELVGVVMSALMSRPMEAIEPGGCALAVYASPAPSAGERLISSARQARAIAAGEGE
jgi:hypothetical protein